MADEKQENNEIASTNFGENTETEGRTSSPEISSSAEMGSVPPRFIQVMQEVSGFIERRSHTPQMTDETVQALASNVTEMHKEEHATKRWGLIILAILVAFLATLLTAVIIACIVGGLTDFLKDVLGNILSFIGGGGSVVLFQKVYQQSTSSSTKDED